MIAIEMVLLIIIALLIGIVIGLKIGEKRTDEAFDLCQKLNEDWYKYCEWLLSSSKKCSTCQDLCCDGCDNYEEGDSDA